MGPPAPPPPGVSPNGIWMLNTCDYGSMANAATSVIWAPNSQPAPSAPSAPVAPVAPSPATAGAQAASRLGLPAPTIGVNPMGTGYVRVPEWLWIDPAQWHPYRTSASACTPIGCVVAVAVAVPQYVTWATGDGASVVCNGPGAVYDTALPAARQTTYCSHTYVASSAGQRPLTGGSNSAAFPVTATITWTVTWSTSGGASGTLPDVHTSSTTALRVEQIEAVRLS